MLPANGSSVSIVLTCAVIDSKPAVWVVDPKTRTVSLKPVVSDRYNLDTIAVTGDLEPGQAVVFAGGQSLRPGQKVQVQP